MLNKKKENTDYKLSSWEVTMDNMEAKMLKRFDELIFKLETFLKRPQIKYKD